MAIHESRWTIYWSRHILMNNLCCTRRLNQLPLSCSLCPSSGLFAWIKAWWLAGGVDIVDILRPGALTSKGLSSIVHLTNPSLKCSLFLGPKLATSILFVPPRHLQMVRTGLHAEELLAVSRGGSGDAARTPAEQWSAVEQQKALTSCWGQVGLEESSNCNLTLY